MAKKKVTRRTKKVISPKRADRFNEDKPKLSFLLDFPNAISGMANVATMGAEKYAKHNWKKGLILSEILDSLLRHAMALHNGEDIDEESGLPHAAHMMWNAAAYQEMLVKADADLDDRDL